MEDIEDEKSVEFFGSGTEKGVVFIDLPLIMNVFLDLSVNVHIQQNPLSMSMKWSLTLLKALTFCQVIIFCFSRYSNIFIFDKSKTFKICDAIRDITAPSKLRFWLFLWNPRYCHNESWDNYATFDNYFQLIFTLSLWSLETSSIIFMFFIKTAI